MSLASAVMDERGMMGFRIFEQRTEVQRRR